MSKIEVDAIEPQSGTTLTIGASGDTVNIASGATITDFTSTGIDDNATSTAITINSSEQVEFTAGTALLPAITTTGDTNTGMWFPAADTIAFSEGGAEAMRIDSSGNLLIGKTSTTNSVAGSKFGSGGQIVATVANDDIMILNRTGNDGDILRFFKDTSEVGVVGTLSSNLYVGSEDTGIYFNNSVDSIYPINTITNAGRDNAIDLGVSATRFKDIYLGGGLYVGGTAAANKLDDYEEGTFTPTFTSTSASFSYSQQYGFYTKIGRSVTCHIFIRAQSSGTTSNSLFISGLPFTSLNSSGLYASGSFGQIESVDYPAGALEITGHVSPNTTQISLQYSRDDNSALGLPASAVDKGTSSGFMFSINYFTD
jgi:hypothetical protein